MDSRYLSASVGYTNIATRVTLLSEFAGEELIEFGTENSISYELSLFTDLRGHFVGNVLIYKVRENAGKRRVWPLYRWRCCRDRRRLDQWLDSYIVSFTRARDLELSEHFKL